MRAWPWPSITCSVASVPIQSLSRPDGCSERATCNVIFIYYYIMNAVRIRILELLVKEDRSVQELQEALGLGQPVVSQQLAVLRSNNIVAGRKEGVSVRYAVRDPRIGTLLDTARQIFNNHLVGTRDLLRQLKREDRQR